MPFLSAIRELRVLICDGNAATSARLVRWLKKFPRLVHSIDEASTVADAEQRLGPAEINAVFIDPITLGVDQASRFVFDVRQKLPWVVFVLYVEPRKARSTRGFYAGNRARWRHYFALSKRLSDADFSDEVFHTLHLCLSDVR